MRRLRRALGELDEHVGQRMLAVTANIYSHVLPDDVELVYSGLFAR